MSQLKIYPLSEKPEYAETCAAWSFSQWGCHMHDANLSEMITDYKKRTKNTDALPLVWIAEINRQITGMVALKEEDGYPQSMCDMKPWLAAVFVHPSFRNQGIAKRLIEVLLQKTQKLGFKEIYLTTPDAEKLYKKFGFITIDKIKDTRGYTDTEYLMRKAL